MGPIRRQLPLLLLLLLGGCLSDDQATFSDTRGTFDEVQGHDLPPLILLPLPLAIDLVALPVDLPRDLYHWLWVGDI